MKKHDDNIFILHIADSFECILQYVENLSEEDFYGNRLVQDAVIRNYEIIGEAAKNLSPEFTALHPEINWHGMAGFRDILIYRYFGVDLEQVWAVTQKNALSDLRQIQSLEEYQAAKKILEKK